MLVKVLGISGSPRKGNSDFLLRKALDKASALGGVEVTTEFYSFRGKEFKPCLGCEYCGKHAGSCVHRDDFGELRDLWLAADVILYSVPVYHMSMPGQVKCFIDRLGNSFFGSFKKDFDQGEESLPKLLKVIGSIAQGAHIFSGQEHTITDLINHALIMQSIPVVGDLWESYIGVGGWTNGRIERTSLEDEYKGEDLAARVAVRASERLAQRAVEIAIIIKSGLRENHEYLKGQNHYKYILSRGDERGRSC